MTIQFNNQSDIVTPSSGQLNNSATVVDKALVLQGGNNLVKYSNTLETTGSAWVSTSSSSTITATLNNIVAPDGTITGTLLTYPINVTGAGIYSTWRANIATTTTGAYTVSVWLKSGSTTSIYIRFNDSSGNRAKLLCNLTSTWQRFTISGTTATTITAISFDIGADGNASETMSAGTIYAWGAQLELGTQASAYTPTTTTAITTTNNISVPSGYLSVGTSNTTGAVTISPISSDGNVTAWGKGQVLISPAGTTTSLGLGLSIDTTNQIAYMSALTPSISWNTMGYRADNFRFLVGGATERVRIDNNGININNAWIGIGGSSITPDTIIARDAANILAQRNSTNAQTFRLYNTYTDSANNEYLSVDWTTSANSATIGTKNTGTGIARDLKLISASRYLILGTEGVNRVVVDSLVNNFYPQVNGTWDLGYTTTRWRNAYFSGVVNTTDIAATGNVTIGGSLTVTGNIAFQNTTINNVTVNTTDSIVTTNTTPSTSNTTGALVVSGGVGIGGALYVPTVYAQSNTFIGQNYDQGTGVLQVTGQSTFNGTVVGKSIYALGGNNFLLYSNTFTNAAWAKTAVTVTANSTTAPD